VLARFRNACPGPDGAKEAAARFRATLHWRAQINTVRFHERGEARRLFEESSNPGSEMYFADSLRLDAERRPYLTGRGSLANPENMHPWNHYEAACLTLDRVSIKMFQLEYDQKLPPGSLTGSYILDLQHAGAQGTVSGTGGEPGKSYKEKRNPYYKPGGNEAPTPWFQQEFGDITTGLGNLKVAIKTAQAHYPEMMHRVIFLNADLMFWGVFKIFSLWVDARSRKKFAFVGKTWREQPMSRLLEWYGAQSLPSEWGGLGESLNVDGFIERAVAHWDATAPLRPGAKVPQAQTRKGARPTPSVQADSGRMVSPTAFLLLAALAFFCSFFLSTFFSGKASL